MKERPILFSAPMVRVFGWTANPWVWAITFEVVKGGAR